MQKHLWKSGSVSLSLNQVSADSLTELQHRIKQLDLVDELKKWIMAAIRAQRSSLDRDSSVTSLKWSSNQEILLRVYNARSESELFLVQFSPPLQISDSFLKNGRKTVMKKGS